MSRRALDEGFTLPNHLVAELSCTVCCSNEMFNIISVNVEGAPAVHRITHIYTLLTHITILGRRVRGVGSETQAPADVRALGKAPTKIRQGGRVPCVLFGNQGVAHSCCGVRKPEWTHALALEGALWSFGRPATVWCHRDLDRPRT